MIQRSRSSGSKNPNFGDPLPGQSLFAYLKRKQKNLLQSAMNDSYRKISNISNKDSSLSFQKQIQQNSHNKDYQQLATSARRNQHRKLDNQSFYKNLEKSQGFMTERKGRQQAEQNFPHAKTITPRKMVTFANELQKSRRRHNHTATGDYDYMNSSANQKSQKKSFIQLISPIKQNNRKADHSSIRESSLQCKNKNAKDIQRYTKKQLNKSMSILQTTLLDLVAHGKKFKRKAHQLFLNTKPFLQFCQFNMRNQRNSKQSNRMLASDVKQQLRLLENQLKEFEVDNANEIMQEFKINIQKHIDSLEAQLNQSCQRQLIREISKIKSQKNEQIDHLRLQIKTLEKNLSICERKLQKTVQKTRNLQQEKNDQQYSFNQKFNSKVEEYQAKLAENSQKMHEIQQKLVASIAQNKVLQKEVKQLRYKKQQIQRNFQQQKQDIISSRQDYLLSQILMLKQQYKRTVQEIERSLQIKNDDQLIQIERHRARQLQFQKEIAALRTLNHQISENQRNLHSQIQKLHAKNECLMTDLHRMNQELYQHWLALKDVRTLAERLRIFDTFSVIYKDLAFNDRLFD